MTWNEICKYIWYRCNELDIDHRELARRVGIPEGSVSRYLNEKRIPNVDKASAMLEAVRCHLLVGVRTDVDGTGEGLTKAISGTWIPVSSGALPELHETGGPATSDYILLHFANAPVAEIGRYEEDGEGGAFYPGDEDEPCTKFGLIVDAWMYIPEFEEAE